MRQHGNSSEEKVGILSGAGERAGMVGFSSFPLSFLHSAFTLLPGTTSRELVSLK